MVMVMAEEEENALSIEPEFPKSRVKKIMNLDEDVKRVSSEALFLVSKSTELFLQLLAEKSAEVVIEKKRKTVKLEHMRIAVKRNRPISDFLLDSLPMPSETTKSDKPVVVADRPKSVPVGTRRIDQIFQKSEAQVEAQVDAQVEAQVEAQIEALVEAQVEAQVEAEIEVQVEAQASEPVPEPMEES